MKKLAIPAMLLLSQLCSAADLEKGFDCYSNKDYDCALKVLEPTADQAGASTFQQTLLGIMYAKGQGVKQDYTKAAEYYRLAADQGNSDSQTYLGLLYVNGQGVKQDKQQARILFEQACENEHPSACKNLKKLTKNEE